MTDVADLGLGWLQDIAIGDHVYRLDMSQVQIQTLPMLRARSDQSDEPGEQAISYENVWPRSQHDTRLGSGQLYFDEDDASRHRFFESININPWRHRRVSLLNDTTLNLDLSAFAGIGNLIMAGSVAYATIGTEIRYSTFPGTSWTTVDDCPAATLKTAASGAHVYLMTAGGIYRIPISQASPAPTLFSAFAVASSAYTIGVANGRLIAGDGTRLVEIDSLGAYGAAGQLDFTHPEGRSWNCVAGAPNGIYVGAGGFGSDIYVLTVNPNTGGLVPTHADSLPEGEQILTMLHYGGVMVLGTDRGFRLANISGDGSLIHGPLVKLAAQDPDAAITGYRGTYCLHERGEFVWFGWSDPVLGYAGLGRMDLSRFTQPLVPAYATDQLFHFGSANALPIGIAAVESLTADVVANVYFGFNSGLIYGNHLTNKASTGWFRTGQITFGTTEKKSPIAIDWRTKPLPAGSSVTIELAVDGGAFATIATDSTTDSEGPSTPVAISGANKGEDFELRFTFTRGTDTTLTPELLRWTLRVMPTPPRVDEYLFTLLFSSTLDDDLGDGSDSPFKAITEYLYLKGLEAEGTVVDLTYGPADGQQVTSVKVDQVTVRPWKWDEDRTFFSGQVVVRLLSAVPLAELPS